MIFQKKIIIGSTMSFIATAIGIIAVFFPDLLNMQKEKVLEFSGKIDTKEDAHKLKKFLSDRFQDKKIFKLDIEICETPSYPYFQASLDTDNNMSKITFINDDQDTLSTVSKDDVDEHGVCYIHYCGGEVYRIPSTIVYPLKWSQTSCEGVAFPAISFKGYAFSEEGNTGAAAQGIVESTFEAIPEKEFKLKNY